MKRLIRCISMTCVFILLCGCSVFTQFMPEWDERFAKYSYAASNSSDSFYIGEDGIYQKSDSERIIATDFKPRAVYANDQWIVCLVKVNDDRNSLDPLDAVVYHIETHETYRVKTNTNYYTGIYLSDNDELIVFQGEGLCAIDLRTARRTTLPVLWGCSFEMDGFEYRLNAYQPDSNKIGIMYNPTSYGSSFAVLSEYGNYGSEEGGGYAILEITDDFAYVMAAKSTVRDAFAVYRVTPSGACTELFTVPDTHDKEGLLRYQFGTCFCMTDGTHILTMRKMDRWHRTETPTESMYSGDALYIVSPDWTSYRMIDLGNKKLISSENGELFYLEKDILYHTTVDRLIDLSFDKIQEMPSGWDFIAFSDQGEFTIY